MFIGISFSFSVTDFLGNAQLFLVALHYSLEFFKAEINTAETVIAYPFPFPVTNFVGNDYAFIGVL